MQDFVWRFLQKHGAQPTRDARGNIFGTKGYAASFPCIVAHLDTVHACKSGYGAYKSQDGQLLFAFDSTTGRQTGVGGDDRCGIAIALQLLVHLPALKVAFFVEEEVGGANGSGFADLAFFADTALVLQCDRRGSTEWAQTVCGVQVASDSFLASIADLLQSHGYRVIQEGSFTDVGLLKRRGLGVCAANLSCGYYEPHSKHETIHLPAVENALNLCLAVFGRVGYVAQPHVAPPGTVSLAG